MSVNNQMHCVGRATADAKSGTTAAGREWAIVHVACSYYAGKDEEGKAKYNADYVPVSVFGAKSKVLATVKKGDLIAVSGRLAIKNVKDEQSGNTYTTGNVMLEDITILSRNKASEPTTEAAQPSDSTQKASEPSSQYPDFEEIVDDDDDLPF